MLLGLEHRIIQSKVPNLLELLVFSGGTARKLSKVISGTESALQGAWQGGARL